MYFCHYTFEATKHPKFLQPAIDILMQADGKAFRDRNDVEILGAKAREALKAATPKGSSAYLYCNYTNEGDITIHIHAANDAGNSVARAYFKPIRGFVRYDVDAKEWKELKAIL